MKRNKFGKTRKDIRWKRGKFVAVENEKIKVRVKMEE